MHYTHVLLHNNMMLLYIYKYVHVYIYIYMYTYTYMYNTYKYIYICKYCIYHQPFLPNPFCGPWLHPSWLPAALWSAAVLRLGSVKKSISSRKWVMWEAQCHEMPWTYNLGMLSTSLHYITNIIPTIKMMIGEFSILRLPHYGDANPLRLS